MGIRRSVDLSDDVLLQLGNEGASSWLSRQILECGVEIATAFGMAGLYRAEAWMDDLTARALVWSVRRDRRKTGWRRGR